MQRSHREALAPSSATSTFVIERINTIHSFAVENCDSASLPLFLGLLHLLVLFPTITTAISIYIESASEPPSHDRKIRIA